MSNRTTCQRKLFGTAGHTQRRELSAVLLLAIAFFIVSEIHGISTSSKLTEFQEMNPSQVAGAIKANAQ